MEAGGMRDDWTKNAVKAAVLGAFKEHVDRLQTGLDDFRVDIPVCQKDRIQVKLIRMYEFVPVDVKVLFALANIFGTKEINVDQYSTPGCETCDWGSSYEVTLDITP